MRNSHAYLFNWRAWVSVFPIVAIGAAIILPIGAVVDLARIIGESITALMGWWSPKMRTITEWACGERKREWDERHEQYMRERRPVIRDVVRSDREVGGDG